MPPTPTFSELIAETKRSAVHLELRDTYFSNPRFEAWRRGDRVDWAERASWWGSFKETIADAVGRGGTWQFHAQVLRGPPRSAPCASLRGRASGIHW
ncbi:DUF6879 family protein [Streptomyces tendae]|uniref:DUF6879 family protein n=1 Tax=Streptomyces tendae TaxID=1932 RepID=UPI0036492B39